MAKKAVKKAIPFEAGIQRLEQIVKDLEQNTISLDEALAFFGEGIELVKHCHQLLDSAEAKVKVLIEDEQGQLITDKFISGDC